MVQCDSCDKWFHFSCVEVDATVEHIAWCCSTCRTHKKTATIVSAASSSSRVELELRKLEEEKALAMKRAEQERELRRNADREYLDALRRTDEEFLVNKFKVLSVAGSSRASNCPTPNSDLRTMNWVETQTKQKPKKEQTPHDLRPLFVPLQPTNAIMTLNASHYEARRTIGRVKLPTFSGDPLDWPMFASAFARSTEQCSYSDDENLIRLQESLAGQALQAARTSLIYANSVPDAMRQLEMLFGQPEMIVSRLVERIRKMPSLAFNRLDMLIRFSIEVKNLCATVRVSKLSDYVSCSQLRQELVDKLPVHFRVQWGAHRVATGVQNLSDFSDWLSSLAEAVSMASPEMNLYEPKAIAPTRPEVKQRVPYSGGQYHRQMVHNDIERRANVPETGALKKNRCCVYCGRSGHEVESCHRFLELPYEQKILQRKEKGLCRTCLQKHGPFCRSNTRCGVDNCMRFHHALLHPPPEEETTKMREENNLNRRQNNNVKPKDVEVISVHHVVEPTLLFRIVPVYLYGASEKIKTFAFLDEGSSVTMISETVAKRLKLDGPEAKITLQWTGDIKRSEQSKKVVLSISGINPMDEKYTMAGVQTTKDLNVAVQTLTSATLSEYSHLQGIPLAPYSDCRPTILIGIDHYKLRLPLEVREGSQGDPVATRTRLGWTLCGAHKSPGQEYQLNVHKCECNTDRMLHNEVKEFFSLENFGCNPGKAVQSVESARANDIMTKTTRYRNGRYETGLLWKYDSIKMPPSRDMALWRLQCFERKLLKNPLLMSAVTEKISDYLMKGYARKLAPNELQRGPRTWYLPVFAVHNPNKPKKLRLVWDAAAKSHGVSLNDFLLPGPDLTSPLLEVLFRFRERIVAISGDLKEMFHQVVVSETDCDAQRFLWRNCDQRKQPDEYVMSVMTFGATCSPSLAQFVKNSHAEKYKDEQPRATIAIQSNHYVDDWLDSFDTIEEAVKVARAVSDIHATAGFEIRNWLSNKVLVLESLGGAEQDQLKSLNSFESAIDKVLGMWWDTVEDTIVFRVNHAKINAGTMGGSEAPTKRQALSIVMSVFDPLGLIASFVVYGKIILQQIWREGTDWDEHISEAAHMKWNMWAQRLMSIEQIAIPRSYLQFAPSGSDVVYDLHIFVDASEEAYAAVAYLRASRSDRTAVECTLMSAKTRVAPQKPLSIPRLELLAAVLGVRLMNIVIQAHTIRFSNRTIWSDSTTVLSWLRSDARRYKQFVALRVSECLESTSTSEWRYVPTKLNVADEATKWQHSSGITSSRWFDGPAFLMQEADQWPCDIRMGAGGAEELRVQLTHSVRCQSKLVTVDLNYFSKWISIVRAQAYFERAVQNFKRKRAFKNTEPLTPQEVRNAEISLIKKAQWDKFRDEVITLGMDSKARVEHTSALLMYSPMLDEQGVICMKGRIDKAVGVSAATKRPMILPRDHVLSRKIVEHYHRLFLHQNHETVVNEVRQKFLIPKLRVLYRSVRASCQVCKIKGAKPIPPEMAELPADRLAVNVRPFTNVGLDYFGPLEVAIGRRTEKRWGVLFTCLSVRAVHLELADSLSTDSCIRSLIRFMARRGTPRRIYSDNATNFHGANNALQTELRKLDWSVIAERFVSIEWRFIPPGSPHFGGAWERLIRIVKSNLTAALPERKTSEEILRTCFAEVEMIVNTRPLTHVPIDAEDAEALTPNHFILGSSSGRKPLCETNEKYVPGSKNWKVTQIFADQFWRRFVREYLPDLARRTKWYVPSKPIQPGVLVFIVDEKNPRGSWPRGKVIEVLKGADGQIRSATIQTSTGVYRRPTTKLAVIDVDQNSGQMDPEPRRTIDPGPECCLSATDHEPSK